MHSQSTSPLLLIGKLLLSSLVLAQAASPDRGSLPVWVMTPKNEASADVSSSLRSSRSMMFNVPETLRPQIGDVTTDEPRNVGLVRYEEYSKPPRAPVSASNLIAVGKVSSFQPFLSQDRTGVYSELSFVIEDILKNDTQEKSPLSEVTILQDGGKLRLPNGRIISSKPSSGSTPLQVDTKYLVFLKYSPSAQAYSVLKAWDFSTSKPVELDHNSHPMASAAALSWLDTSSQASMITSIRQKAR